MPSMGVERSGLPLWSLCALGAALALIALAQATGATTQVVDGDWVVSGGLTEVRDTTIDVRGHVTVVDGGVLSLDNCTLLLNATTNSNNYLEVSSTGRFIARNCTIRGETQYARFDLSNDTVLEDCRISHLHGYSYNCPSILCDGGRIRMVRTELTDFDSYGMVVRTDLTLEGCELRASSLSAVTVQDNVVLRASRITIERCRMEHVYQGEEGWLGIAIETTWPSYPIDVRVRNTTVEGYRNGLWVEGKAGLTIEVEHCQLLGNAVGAAINSTGAKVTLRRNLIGQGSGQYTMGLSISGDPKDFVLENNTVVDVWAGVHLLMLPGTPRSQSWGGLHTRQCANGLMVSNPCQDGHYQVTVSNSSFLGDWGAGSCFCVGNDIDLSIYDTEHPAQSCEVWGKSTIKAHSALNVTDIRWRDGPPITSGALCLEEHDQPPRATLDIPSLARTQVLSWWADDEGIYGAAIVHPTVHDGAYTFEGAPIDLWGSCDITASVVIEDDFAPVAGIDVPADGGAYGSARLQATGTVLEAGSGISALQYRLDDVTGASPVLGRADWWRIELPALADGRHVLEVYAFDMCGNLGPSCKATFDVDTVPPSLALGPVPAYVATVSVTVRGTTEPGAVVAVGQVPCTVAPDGTFSTDVPLLEGQNKFLVVAVDRALNENTSLVVVVRDTLVPMLDVNSPENGTWTNATTVSVTGYVSLDATLEVNGVPVAFSTGRFSYEMPLTEGRFEVALRAVDRAGNGNRTLLVLNVDWTPPRLEVLRPDRDTVHTSAGHIEFSGEVHETALGAFTINGTAVGVFLDVFLAGFSVPEGRTCFVLRAEDLAGNSVSRTFAVNRDITLPNCTVKLLPIGGEMRVVQGKRLLTAPTLEVKVEADEDVIVTLGDLVEGPCRHCVFRLTLEEGPNVLVVTAHDLAGNMATPFSGLVTLDTVPPYLEVRSPHQGWLTSRDSAIVEGLTEPGAVLTIGGRVQHANNLGFFRVEVPLRRGSNVIDVTATDEAGHVNSTAIEVTREQGFGQIAEDIGASAMLAVGLACALLVLMLVRHRRKVPRERSDPAKDAKPPPERRGGGAG